MDVGKLAVYVNLYVVVARCSYECLLRNSFPFLLAFLSMIRYFKEYRILGSRIGVSAGSVSGAFVCMIDWWTNIGV